MKIKTCKTCGKDFPVRSSNVYYSDACRPLGSKPLVKKALRQQLADKYGFVCSYCGIDLTNMRVHLDHIIPQSQGGSDDISNLALSCVNCNYSKHAQSVDEFLRYMKYIRSNDFKCPIIERL